MKLADQEAEPGAFVFDASTKTFVEKTLVKQGEYYQDYAVVRDNSGKETERRKDELYVVLKHAIQDRIAARMESMKKVQEQLSKWRLEVVKLEKRLRELKA